MTTPKRVTAGWWKLLFRVWLALFIGVTLIYALGGDGFRVQQTGTTTSFNRDADYALLRINDSLAFHVRPQDPNSSVSVVRYAEGSLPFSLLLGRYELDTEKMPAVTHQRGDWVYNTWPQFGPLSNIDIYNIRTGEAIRLLGNADAATAQQLDLRTLPEYASRGLLGTEADKLASPEQLATRYPALSVPKESAVVFVSAFLIVGIFLLLLWPFARRKVAAA